MYCTCSVMSRQGIPPLALQEYGLVLLKDK